MDLGTGLEEQLNALMVNLWVMLLEAEKIMVMRVTFNCGVLAEELGSFSLMVLSQEDRRLKKKGL